MKYTSVFTVKFDVVSEGDTPSQARDRAEDLLRDALSSIYREPCIDGINIIKGQVYEKEVKKTPDAGTSRVKVNSSN